MTLRNLLSSPNKALFTVAFLLFSFSIYAQPTYCTSGLGGASYDVPIDSVTIPGTTLNNGTPGNLYTYSAYPISGSTTCHLQQGGTYTIAVNSHTSGSTSNMAMWIDFNQNGTYDVYEWFSVGTNITSAVGTATLTFTVPLTARAGITGLRIRTRDVYEGSIYAYDACTNYTTGETEDYYITIDSTLPCSGTPAAGTITGATNVCPGIGFTLSLSGYTVSTGLTYQWESRPAGVGSFTAITGATSSTYSATSIGASTDYKLIITCTASTLSSTSATYTVTLNPPYMCYCDDSTLLGGADYYVQLDSVAIPGTTLDNYIPFNPDIYSSYPASGSTTATLQQGATYTIAVNSGYMYSAYVGMWIDYDHSGTFDPSEYTVVGAGTTPGTQSVTFTVPLTALTGQTGLRIRNNAYTGPFAATDPCTNEYDGETQDYIITIDTTLPCSGTPVAGTISGTDSVCPAQVFTMTDAGFSIATGIGYQWVSRPAGSGSFSAIAGATTSTLTLFQPIATDYELEITCAGSSLTATTAIFTVHELPFTRCYCDSASLGGAVYYAPIDSVSIVGTTLNNNTPGNPNTYSVYPATGSTTATLQQGGYYTIAVSSYTSGDVASSALWIDYNHNGTYDPVEYTSVGTDVLGTAIATFRVPTTALTGQTGLRIRTVYPAFDSMTASDACTDFYSGETEDYVITIDTTYPCTGTPVAGTISGITTICPSNSFALNLTGYTIATGTTISWESSPPGAGTFTAIAGANTTVYNSAGITASTDYRVVVTCTSSGMSATSAIFTVNLNSFLYCYCSPAATGTSLVSYGEDEISTVWIAGTTFNPTSIAVPYTTGYIQIAPSLSSNTATMDINTSYAFTVVIDSYEYTPSSSGVWIDYDHSGTFEASEYTSFSPDEYNGVYSGSVTIPASSLPGQTGMRITTDDGYLYATGSCMMINEGEVADFVITIDTGNTYVTPVTNTDFSVKAFPNPVNKMVTIQTIGTAGNNRTVVLTDVTGQVIEKVSMDTYKTDIDMGTLAPGVYLVKYEDDKHSLVIKVNKL